MRVYIGGLSIFKNRSGIGQLTKRLSETLAKNHPENQYTFFSFRLWPKPLPEKVIVGPNVNYRFVRFLPGKLYNLLLRLGLAPPIDWLLRSRPDIIFFPNFYRWPVANRKIKTVVAVHDLSFIYYPQFASPRNLKDNLRFVPQAIKKADRILTISESSKRAILSTYPAAKGKVDIVYPAVDPADFYPRSKQATAEVGRKYKLPAKYILFTSTLEPRKNVQGLVKAYEALPADLRDEYGLVLVGGRGWQDEEIVEAIAKAKARGANIVQPGYVKDEDLAAVYSGASLFAFPSFYEGFGMPPLEAMACGVPVICSNNSSLPEAAGDAALYIKAEDTAAITETMQKVLSNPDLAAKLKQKGLAQARKFSWQKSAQQLNTIFEKLV